MYSAASANGKQTTRALRRGAPARKEDMTAIVHALYVIGQLFAIMGVVFVVPLLVCDCCRYCWKRRCARRERCQSDRSP